MDTVKNMIDLRDRADHLEKEIVKVQRQKMRIRNYWKSVQLLYFDICMLTEGTADPDPDRLHKLVDEVIHHRNRLYMNRED